MIQNCCTAWVRSRRFGIAISRMDFRFPGKSGRVGGFMPLAEIDRADIGAPGAADRFRTIQICPKDVARRVEVKLKNARFGVPS